MTGKELISLYITLLPSAVRRAFCDGGNVLRLQVPSVVTSCKRLLSTWNVARAAEDLNSNVTDFSLTEV